MTLAAIQPLQSNSKKCFALKMLFNVVVLGMQLHMQFWKMGCFMGEAGVSGPGLYTQPVPTEKIPGSG